jgi:hypothetical protein
MSSNNVERAFEAAKKKFGGLPAVCGVLNVSTSYVYMAINRGEASLPCAMKLEALLDGDFTWQELCPRADKDVKEVLERANKL